MESKFGNDKHFWVGFFILNKPLDTSLCITHVKINNNKKMGHQFLGALKTSFCNLVILFAQHFADYFLSGIGSKNREHFWSNNHDTHCRFGTNFRKITPLSLKVADQLCLLFFFISSRLTGDDGPAMLMGIDLFQKGISSDFQGLRNDFNLFKRDDISLPGQGWVKKKERKKKNLKMEKSKVKAHSLD